MTTATETQPLHLLRLEVEGYRGVRALTVDAAGKSVVFRGTNGAGKSSALDAAWALIKGHSSRDCPNPINAEANRALIRGELGSGQKVELVVERTITPHSSRLTITPADGSRVARRQELLDALVGLGAYLRPELWLEEKPREQLESALRFVGARPPVEQAGEITGEDHPARPGETADDYLERLTGEKGGIYYEQRRQAAGLAAQKEQALAEERRRLLTLGGPAAAGSELSTAELLKQRGVLQARIDQRRAVQEEARHKREEYTRGADRLKQRQAERTIAAREVSELEQKLAAARARLEDLDGKIARGKGIVQELEAEAQAAEAAAGQLADPVNELLALDRQIVETEAASKQRLQRQLCQENAEKLDLEARDAQGEHRRISGILDRLRGLRDHFLDGVDLELDAPVTVQAGELHYHGRPLRAASDGERLDVACAFVMHGRQRLRLLFVDGAEKLDRKAMERVLAGAGRRGYQVWAARTTEEGDGLSYEIVEERQG